MMTRLFGNGPSSMTSAALIVAIFSVMSRLAGFVRDRILISIFGTGATLDAYYQAQRIPDFLLQLFVVGALSASFIPIFTRYFLAKDEQKAWKYTNAMLTLLVAGFVMMAGVGIAFAPQLARIVAPGFDDARLAVLIPMMRVMFVGQVFFSVSMVFGSVLQGAKRFVLYAFAPIANNIGIIIGAIFFVALLGPVGLAWGSVLGAFLHMFVQGIGVFALGYVIRPRIFWSDRDVVRTITQMGPRVLGLAVSQINTLVIGVIGSTLAVGSIAILQFASTLNFFPIGVIGVSYAIAAFPAFCEYLNRHALDAFRTAFSEAIRQVLFFIMPVTVVTLLLRAQIVRIVFGAEGFDWEHTVLTADTLACFALSFFAQAVVFVFVRAYYALEDTVTPLVIGVVSACVNIFGALLLVNDLGVVGLGIAFSASSIVQAVLLWVFLRVRMGTLHEGLLLRSLAKLTFAAAASAAVMQLVKLHFVRIWELDTFWHVVGQAGSATGAGLLTYAGIAFILRSPEMRTVMRGFRRALLRTARPAEVTEVV